MKYKLTEKFKINAFGVKLFQMVCTEEIKSRGVKVGDIGGWIESERLKNGDARVYGNAWVFGNAEVFGNARVFGDAQVYGNAEVFGNARVYDNAEVFGDAQEKTLKDYSTTDLLSELLRRDNG